MSDTARGGNSADWNAFLPDAAEAISARDSFEDASAGVLEAPFDYWAQNRLRSALRELQAATPAARRVALTSGEE